MCPEWPRETIYNATVDQAMKKCTETANCQAVMDSYIPGGGGAPYPGIFELCLSYPVPIGMTAYVASPKEPNIHRDPIKYPPHRDAYTELVDWAGKYECSERLFGMVNVTLDQAKKKCTETPNCQAVLHANTNYTRGDVTPGSFQLCKSYPIPDGMTAYIPSPKHPKCERECEEPVYGEGRFGHFSERERLTRHIKLLPHSNV